MPKKSNRNTDIAPSQFEHSSNSSVIPEVPILRPTYEEFRNFYSYLMKIEESGFHHVGLCKIIPPVDWIPRKNRTLNSLSNFKITSPIKQQNSGYGGVYLQSVHNEEDISFENFLKRCTSEEKNSLDENITELLWNSLELKKPLYGANVPGTLTDKNLSVFNIGKLDSLLNVLLNQIKVEGVNTPYLYFGSRFSSFAWHVEDADLYSINYLHFGAHKYWHVIPPAYARKFEALAKEYFRSEFLVCDQFLRHKSILISPKVLRNAGIPVKFVVQHENEIIITFPYSYHSGFNSGINIAESTNFALPRYLPFLRYAKFCYCWKDTVRFNVDKMIQNTGLNVKDYNPIHPLDIYELSTAPAKKALTLEYDNPPKKLDMDLLQSYFISLLPKPLEESEITLGDMIFLKEFIKYRNLFNPKSARLLDISMDTLIDYHRRLSSFKPHCAVCASVVPPALFRKRLEINLDKLQFSMPSSSLPLISEIAYVPKNPEVAVKLMNIPKKVDSPLVTCYMCYLTVHARCYGLCDMDSISSENLKQINWMCNNCQQVYMGRPRPKCILCPFRGGAMVPLANKSENNSDNQYFIHIVCALGCIGCAFIDVSKRIPCLFDVMLNTDLPWFMNRSIALVGSLKKQPVCLLCRSLALGGRPENLMSCWKHPNILVHPTCAQFAGQIIGIDTFPWHFHYTCFDHPMEYDSPENRDFSSPITVGERVIVIDTKTNKYKVGLAIDLIRDAVCYFHTIEDIDVQFTVSLEKLKKSGYDWDLYGPPKSGTEMSITSISNKKIIYVNYSPQKWMVRVDSTQRALSRYEFYSISEYRPLHIQTLFESSMDNFKEVYEQNIYSKQYNTNYNRLDYQNGNNLSNSNTIEYTRLSRKRSARIQSKKSIYNVINASEDGSPKKSPHKKVRIHKLINRVSDQIIEESSMTLNKAPEILPDEINDLEARGNTRKPFLIPNLNYSNKKIIIVNPKGVKDTISCSQSSNQELSPSSSDQGKTLFGSGTNLLNSLRENLSPEKLINNGNNYPKSISSAALKAALKADPCSSSTLFSQNHLPYKRFSEGNRFIHCSILKKPIKLTLQRPKTTAPKKSEQRKTRHVPLEEEEKQSYSSEDRSEPVDLLRSLGLDEAKSQRISTGSFHENPESSEAESESVDLLMSSLVSVEDRIKRPIIRRFRENPDTPDIVEIIESDEEQPDKINFSEHLVNLDEIIESTVF